MIFKVGIVCCLILTCVQHSHQQDPGVETRNSRNFFLERLKRHAHEHDEDEHLHDHSNKTQIDCGVDSQMKVDSHGDTYCVSSNWYLDYRVWLPSSGAVLVISLCGIFGVLVVPIVEQIFYQHLIQFLIALAVGTLSGDALLHLLPHAIIISQKELFGEVAHDIAENAMWKGFFALVALVVFFLLERIINMVGEWKEGKMGENRDKKVRIVRSGHKTSDKAVGERLCKHKYSTYCVADIDLEQTQDDRALDTLPNDKNETFKTEEREVMLSSPCSDEDVNNCKSKPEGNGDTGNTLKPLSASASIDGYDTVFVREHEHIHHGHSHAHSHLHSTPNSITSVAWMVIFGDGIHNLADGLAIGTAFVQDPLTGIATSIAILCHELPHEIGDFAMLLKTGMSLRQAIFYNVVSSVLSFIGMVIGILLGNVNDWAGWIFAATAGIFLYVALVDMIPELNSGHSHPFSNSIQTESHYLELGLQVLGICIGITVMLLIALYEEDLKDMFRQH